MWNLRTNLISAPLRGSGVQRKRFSAVSALRSGRFWPCPRWNALHRPTSSRDGDPTYRKLSRGPVEHAGSNQFKEVLPGDIVWIVSVHDGRILLPKAAKRGIDRAVEAVVQELEKLSKPVSGT